MTEKNVYGHFAMKDGINTSFDFDSSGHFTYIQCNPLNAVVKKRPYILTKGIWTFQDSGFITLNSLSKNDDYRTAALEKIKTTNISSFTFYDMFGDTLSIVGATKNGQWFGRVHDLIKSFEVNLSQSDTVTADLIGYDKFKFVYSDTSQFVYHVTLYPSYFADYFKNKKLLVKRNQLVDTEINKTYKKKSGM